MLASTSFSASIAVIGGELPNGRLAPGDKVNVVWRPADAIVFKTQRPH